MITQYRMNAKDDFEKDFFKLINNSDFGKAMRNVRRDIYTKLVNNDTKRNKPKYGDKVKLCYMDTDSFIMHVKTDEFYKDIAKDVEKNYDTSNYTCEKLLPMG